MRPLLVALLATLLALTVVPFPQDGASASCAAPTFSKERIVLSRAGEQTVRAEGVRDGCEDGESCSAGCDDCKVEDPETPRKDVELRIVQMGRSWSLGTVDADEDNVATWTFDLPAGVEPGPARLSATGIRPVGIRVR